MILCCIAVNFPVNYGTESDDKESDFSSNSLNASVKHDIGWSGAPRPQCLQAIRGRNRYLPINDKDLDETLVLTCKCLHAYCIS